MFQITNIDEPNNYLKDGCEILKVGMTVNQGRWGGASNMIGVAAGVTILFSLYLPLLLVIVPYLLHFKFHAYPSMAASSLGQI